MDQVDNGALKSLLEMYNYIKNYCKKNSTSYWDFLKYLENDPIDGVPGGFSRDITLINKGKSTTRGDMWIKINNLNGYEDIKNDINEEDLEKALKDLNLLKGSKKKLRKRTKKKSRKKKKTRKKSRK